MSLGHRANPASRIRFNPKKQHVSPCKTYDVTRGRVFSGDLQIHSNNELLYTFRAEGAILHKNKIALHTGENSGPLLATVELDKTSKLSIKVERSTLSSPDNIALTKASAAFDEFYEFEAAGQKYAWQRMRQWEVTVIGSEEKRCGGLDWKLVHDPTIPADEEEPQRILAVYLHDETWKGPKDQGWIHWTSTPLDEIAEVVILAILIGADKQSQKGTHTMALGDVFGGVGGGAAIGIGGGGA